MVSETNGWGFDWTRKGESGEGRAVGGVQQAAQSAAEAVHCP